MLGPGTDLGEGSSRERVSGVRTLEDADVVLVAAGVIHGWQGVGPGPVGSGDIPRLSWAYGGALVVLCIAGF
jgi:hypothetical protein